MSLSFLSPLFLWGLLALPLVVLLHFIRSRRKRQQVSALFLWQKALEQSAKRRRFSPTWLLLLQLFFVTLAVLALAQPNLSFQGPPDRIFIVDASASMSATDSDGVRLQKATDEAAALARSSGRVAVIRAGLDATVLQGLTGSSGEVASALNSIVAVDRLADMDRAIALAQSVAPEADLHIFSDSTMPTGAQITQHVILGDALNVGINTFDIGIQQAFVSVVSNHPRPQEVQLLLLQGEQVVAQSNLLVPAAGQANVSFPLPDSSGFFEARIIEPDWDSLTLDNNAFAGTRSLRVVLNEADEQLERALSAIPNMTFQVLPNSDLNAPGFDVKMSFGNLPENASGNYVIFSPKSDLPVYKAISSWDRSSDLLRFVDLTSTVVGIDGSSSLSLNENWDVLAESSDLTPIIAQFSAADLKVVTLNFHPSQTDMINRSAFPLLMTNIMNSFRDEGQLLLGEGLPEGSSFQVGGELNPKLKADEPGVYEINGETYTASLLSAGESRLPVAEVAELIEEVTEDTRRSERVQTLAFWLTLLATLFLLSEWLLWARSRNAWAFRSR